MRKRITAVIVCLLLLVGFTLPGSAEPITTELFTITKSYSMVVTVYYDVELTPITFTDPSGKTVDAADLRSESGEGYVQYYLPAAARGTWKVTYDKGRNSEFDIYYSSYVDSLTITDFTVKALENKKIPFSFCVESDSSAKYRFAIYAVVLDAQGTVEGEKSLHEGTATPGDEIKGSLSIAGLQDYPEYRLRLDVYRTVGVEEAFDSVIADTVIAISGNSTLNPIENMRVSVYPGEGEISLDWADWKVNSAEYILGVFGDNSRDPFYAQALPSGTTAHRLFYDPGMSSARISLAYQRGTQTSAALEKSLPLQTGVSFSVAEQGVTASRQATVTYTVPRPTSVEVTVGDKTDTIELDGSGSFSLTLAQNTNQITLAYSGDDPFVRYIEHFAVVLDITPPALRLPENTTVLFVDAADYTLAGITEAGATLQIDGKQIDVAEDGTFLCTLPLAQGENVFRVSVSDSVGNTAAQDVVIYRANAETVILPGDAGEDSLLQKIPYLPLILSFAASLIFVLTVVLAKIGYRKADDKAVYIACLIRSLVFAVTVVVLAFAGYTVYRYVSVARLIDGVEFVSVVDLSVEEAYRLLEKAKVLKAAMKTRLIVSGVMAVLTLISFAAVLILKKIKKRRTGDTPAVPEDKNMSEEGKN